MSGQRIPEILTDDERRALLDAPSKTAPTGIRNRAMMAVMLDTGLRCAECCDLGTRDINTDTGRVTVVQGKGGKDRILWAGPETLEAVKAWLKVRPAADGALLFSTLAGDPVSTRYVRAMVERMATRANITHTVHPHTLRHTFGTDLYRQTHNIRLTQKALGHSSVTTTTIYTHIVDAELEAAMKELRT